MRAEPGERLVERVAHGREVAGAQLLIARRLTAALQSGEDRVLHGCSYGLGVNAGLRSSVGARRPRGRTSDST